MKRGKLEPSFMLPNRITLLQIFMVVMLLYLLLMGFEIPLAFSAGLASVSSEKGGAFGFLSNSLPVPLLLEQEPSEEEEAFQVPKESPLQKVSTFSFNESFTDDTNGEFSKLHKAAKHTWVVGKKLWDEVEARKVNNFAKFKVEKNGSTRAHIP